MSTNVLRRHQSRRNKLSKEKKKRKPQETMFCDHHKGAKSSIYGDLIPNDTPIVPH